MKTMMTVIGALAVSALPAMAELGLGQGDPVAGEKAFKTCQTCHSIVGDDGVKIAGTGAKTGPNLFKVIGRPAGSYPDFKYGDSMLAAGAKGLVWNEDEFTKYTKDPSAFLQDYLGDPKAKGKMMFKVKNPDDAHNIWAYFSTIMPVPEGATAAPAASGG